MLGVFADGMGGGVPQGRWSVEDLAPTESRLLWALRRLALMQPIGAARCHAVHIALQQDFGDAGLGIEHLLRCILVGLAQVSTRRLAIGEPGCGLVTGDEGTLLALLGGSAGQARLGALAGTAGAAGLLPLFVAIAALVEK